MLLAEDYYRICKREAVNDLVILIVHVDPVAKVHTTLANVASDAVPG